MMASFSVGRLCLAVSVDKDSARREEYKANCKAFAFIPEPPPILGFQPKCARREEYKANRKAFAFIPEPLPVLGFQQSVQNILIGAPASDKFCITSRQISNTF